MPTLRAVGVLSTARLATIVMGIVGLAAGILYSFGGAIFDALVSLEWVTAPATGAWSTPGLGWGTALAFLALLGMPILFAACGLVVGTAGAILYNLVARWVGGIEIDLDE